MRVDYAECKSLCDVILNASGKIQSVAILNKMGRPIEKSTRPGYANQFPDKTSEMLFMQCVLQVSMGRDLDEQYGPINYYVSERASVTMLTFPVGDDVIFLTASKNVSPIALAKKVASVISDSTKQTREEVPVLSLH